MSEAPAPAQDRRGWQAVAAVVAASLALHALLLGALALWSVRGDPPPAQAFELTTLEPVEDLPALTRWLEDHLASDLFAACMVRHPPWTGQDAPVTLG